MTSRVTLTLHAAAAAAIREAVDSTEEVAGVLIVGVSKTDDEIRFLAREFHPASAGSYLERTPRKLGLTSGAYMPALARAADLGASAVFIHSHPEDAAVMSIFDDEVDEKLRSVFQIRTGSPFYGSVVFRLEEGQLTFTGRAWRAEESLGHISLLREFGDRFRFIPALDSLAAVPPSSVFDRQVRAFGPDMQALLGQLHVGVVGAGGTGSAVIEQLIRLGVGMITVVDFDTITDTNVTRVYGSRMADLGMPKVEVIERHAEDVGLATRVNPKNGSVTRKANALALASCDLVFACTDDHTGRLVLAKLAYWLLIPVFDMGARIDAKEGVLEDVICRVNLEMPGTACGQCCGFIHPERILAESLSDTERREREREGYVQGLDTRDPAVITYTTLAAALAINELLVRLTGLSALPAASVIFQAQRRGFINSDRATKSGHWCGDERIWGTGITERFLDLTWL